MSTKKKEEKTPAVVKTTADLQRIRLEKLMKNPEKPVFIPETRTEKLPRVFNPPEFIRNIWGSSAGAGSGDFHVYRGVRRREYARQKHEKEKNAKEELDEEYHRKVEENQKAAEEKMAKNRAKRLKKKQRMKNAKKKKPQTSVKEASDSDSEKEGTGDESDHTKAEEARSMQTAEDGSAQTAEDGSSCGTASSQQNADTPTATPTSDLHLIKHAGSDDPYSSSSGKQDENSSAAS